MNSKIRKKVPRNGCKGVAFHTFHTGERAISEGYGLGACDTANDSFAVEDGICSDEFESLVRRCSNKSVNQRFSLDGKKGNKCRCKRNNEGEYCEQQE